MKKFFVFLKQRPQIWLTLYVPLYIVCFMIVNSHTAFSDSYWVSYSTIDDYIPFVSAFIIPYILWYPYLVLPALHALVKNKKAYCRYMYTIIFAFTLGLITFVVFPSAQELRPNILPDNIFGKLTGMIYAADPPRNVLPSGHVSASIAAWFLVRNCGELWHKRSVRIVSTILAILIAVSTVFVKQHSINDVFVSICVMIPIIWLVYYNGFAKLADLLGIAKTHKTESCTDLCR